MTGMERERSASNGEERDILKRKEGEWKKETSSESHRERKKEFKERK